MSLLPTLILIIFLGAGIWFGLRAVGAWRTTQRVRAYDEWKSAQRYTILKILVPRQNEKTPQAAEQMFAALHGIFRDDSLFQDQVSVEFVSLDKFIYFYVHVPQHLKEFVEGQIYAQYPTVEITEAEDYSQVVDQSRVVVGAELVLTKDEVYPIQTFLNFTVDPLSGITAVLGNVGTGEQLWTQMIIQPVSETWQEKGIKFVAAKRAGVPLHKPNVPARIAGVVVVGFLRLLQGLFQAVFVPGSNSAEAEGGGEGGNEKGEKKPELSAPEEVALKGIETKVTKPGFATKIRLVAVAGDAYTARSKIAALTGAYKQFNTTNLNGFRSIEAPDAASFLAAYQARAFDDAGSILNTEELASLYHLPTVTVETPNIAWAGSKKGEPPANLPLAGTDDQQEVTFFGTTDFRNFQHKFGIKKNDRRLHMYAIGKTGTGKSTLLENMIVGDIEKGRGVAVVDPHGQLVGDVLLRIPSYRINDVIYFNTAEREYPIGFNILENVEPDLRSVVASGVVGVFKKLFAESWGPRLEYILRNAIIALLYYPETTLLGINRLLVDDEYRRRVVRKITDPVIRDFFEEEYNKYDPKFRREAIASIQNKAGQFLSSTTIRNIIGQPKSAIDIRQVMDEGKILLIDLSIGKIGEDSAALLGSMIITKIQLAAMSRADVAEEARPDFYLYVDEFQNFATDSFAVILSEARKYHLNRMLTTQYIAQMPENVAKAVVGNVGTILSFRVGPTDASGLVKEFEPVFESHDLVNLSNYQIYVKMAIDGVTRPAFSATTLPPPSTEGNPENAEKVIRVSRERYAKPRDFVEKKIQEWADDVQVRQAQEWRRSIQEREAGQQSGAGQPKAEPELHPQGFVKVADEQGSRERRQRRRKRNRGGGSQPTETRAGPAPVTGAGQGSGQSTQSAPESRTGAPLIDSADIETLRTPSAAGERARETGSDDTETLLPLDD